MSTPLAKTRGNWYREEARRLDKENQKFREALEKINEGNQNGFSCLTIAREALKD